MKKLLYKLLFTKAERQIIEDAVFYSSHKYQQHGHPDKSALVDPVCAKLRSLV